MKRWIPALFLPLVLAQAPALAQTEPPELIELPQPQVTIPATEPTLVPLKGTDQVRLQLVNCRWWLDCAIARLLLPASATINQRQLQFDNSTQAPIQVLNAAVVAQGDFTGYQLNNSAIALPQEIQPLAANQIVSIPINLDRSQMPPDQYSGAIYLTLQNRGDRLALPLNVSVRSGALLPLIVLFFGIILGRLFKYMQERGEPQAKTLEEVYRLQGDIAAVNLDEPEKQMLSSMVGEVRTLVAREQLDGAATQIQAIRDRLATLVKLKVLEDQLNEQNTAIAFPDDVDKYTIRISKVRRLVAQREDAKAKELLTKISTDLDSVGARAAGDATVTATKRSLEEAVSAIDQINQPSALKTRSVQRGKLQQLLVNLSGVSDQVRAEATFWVVRPLLSLVLLVGLSAVGIGSLYVENGTTFGARPFADYLGLILWGLSADVASRSLSSLQGGKE
jgi:hypothetical protein